VIDLQGILQCPLYWTEGDGRGRKHCGPVLWASGLQVSTTDYWWVKWQLSPQVWMASCRFALSHRQC